MPIANGAFAISGGATGHRASARVPRSRRVSRLRSKDGGPGPASVRAREWPSGVVPGLPVTKNRAQTLVLNASNNKGSDSRTTNHGNGASAAAGAPSFNRGGAASPSQSQRWRLDAASSVGPGDGSLYRAYSNRKTNGRGRCDTPQSSGSGSWDEDISSSSSFDQQNLPLKINQDVLLYNARAMRSSAMKIRKRDERVKTRLNSIRLYERAKAVDPSDGRAYVGIAQVLRQLGDVASARKTYQDGCDATGGDNAFIWQAWASLEENEGDITKARQLYDAALAADKTHAAAWHGWAVLEKKQGNFQRARDLLVKGRYVLRVSQIQRLFADCLEYTTVCPLYKSPNTAHPYSRLKTDTSFDLSQPVGAAVESKPVPFSRARRDGHGTRQNARSKRALQGRHENRRWGAKRGALAGVGDA